MTAEPVSSISPSRRALLAGAVGAAVASVAGAIGRPGVVQAADGNPVLLGTANTANNTTHLTTGTGVGLYAKSVATGGIGLYGDAAASSGVAHGIFAVSASTSGIGMRAHAYAGSGATVGVSGRVDSPDGTAILGYSGTGAEPPPVAKTGVYGYAVQDSNARGVWGRSASGRGVFGHATTGQGVRGYATTGAALYGSTSGLKSGFALRTVGRVRMDNCVGIATVNAGNTNQTVTPGIDLTSTSAVVATLQGSAGGTTTVHRVTVNATADTFTIFLTATAASDVNVAWHVFG